LPAGYPPRAAAGFSVVAQFFVLARFGLLADDTIFSAIREGANALRNSDAYALAEEFADLLYDRVPVLYAPDPYECVAVRFRQQINENAKMLCWHHVVPEMNHNELVGWEHPAWLCEKTMVVFFRGADEHPRHAPRFDFTRKVVDRKGAGVLEIHAVGPTPAARVLYLIHLCDHISTHLARLNGADPTPVAVIDELKAALAR
jgi:glucose/mannose-6-phosphate isomerase